MSSLSTELDEQSATRSTTDRAHRLRWVVLAVLGIAQLMVVLDATIVNIALPAAQLDLGFDNAQRSWVVTAYALTFGSLLLLGGRLSDLFGARRVFLLGLVGFAVASAAGGAAANFEMLVAARAGQGLFAALLAPATLALLATTFTAPDERGKAFGIFGAIAGGGGAIGLLLGGVLTEWANWRWALYVNLAFAAIALVVGAAVLVKRASPAIRPRLDIPGTITVTAALFAIVYGFARAETAGWADGLTLGFLVGGTALLALFVVLQQRVTNPLLPMRVVLDRTRAGSFVTVFMAGVGMFAVFLFLTYYLQNTLRYSPIATGFAFMPMIAGLMITATLATSIVVPRYGMRVISTAGMVVAAVGMVLLTQIDLDSTYWTDIVPGLALAGIGVGAAMAPAMQGAISGVRTDDAGVASAMVNTMQQIGGSIGVALLSTIAASAASNYLNDHEGANGATAQLVAANVEITSYTTTFWWAAGIFTAGAIIVGTLLRSGKLPTAPEGTTVIAH